MIYLKVEKSALTDKQELSRQLAGLSSQVKELPKACLYSPQQGNLWRVINLLKEHTISFDILSFDDVKELGFQEDEKDLYAHFLKQKAIEKMKDDKGSVSG